MLETGRCHREVERVLEIVAIGPETVDQSGAEGIAAADTIDDVHNVVDGGAVERAALPKNA